MRGARILAVISVAYSVLAVPISLSWVVLRTSAIRISPASLVAMVWLIPGIVGNSLSLWFCRNADSSVPKSRLWVFSLFSLLLNLATIFLLLICHSVFTACITLPPGDCA